MLQVPDQLWQIFATVVGGLISAFAGYHAQKLAERRSKNQLLMTRLEELYALCQELYEGHAGRLAWLGSNERADAVEYSKMPKHPGQKMSEIKMRVRSYAPHLLQELSRIDAQHQYFKNLGIELDAIISKGGVVTRGDHYDPHDLNVRLLDLGAASNDLKLGVTEKLKAYFS